MDTHVLALQLMAIQGCLGAFDTFYHHELTEALAQRQTAQRELAIHAVRALIYGFLFIGLSSWVWHGIWALVLLAVFGIEIVLTLWDFVIEDQTRLLPASERITHTVLAINGGAFIALLAIMTPQWMTAPAALSWQPHGMLSIFLALCGIGVGISGLRDGMAAYRMRKQGNKEAAMQEIHFSAAAESVLITDATGFIGQRLVRALLKNGQLVTILTRHPKQAAWLFDGQVRCVPSLDALSISHRFDVVINLAGARILGWRWTAARRAVLHGSRTALTHRIVEWIEKAEHKPRLLMSASAIGFYGIQRHGDQTPLTETSPPQGIFMSQLCQEWESAAQQANKFGVQVARMRFGVVFGKQGALPMMTLPIKLGLGGRLGNGLQTLSWIHIDDVLRGMAHVWGMSEEKGGKNADGAYNFVAPESVSQWQFNRIAAEILHRPCFMPTPALPIRIALGEQSDLLLEGQKVIPARLLQEGFLFHYPDLKNALRDALV